MGKRTEPPEINRWFYHLPEPLRTLGTILRNSITQTLSAGYTASLSEGGVLYSGQHPILLLKKMSGENGDQLMLQFIEGEALFSRIPLSCFVRSENRLNWIFERTDFAAQAVDFALLFATLQEADAIDRGAMLPYDALSGKWNALVYDMSGTARWIMAIARCAKRPENETVFQCINRLLLQQPGVQTEETYWTELQKADAIVVLAEFLAVSMAYDSRIMTDEAALNWAKQFCDFFGPETSFMMNLDFDDEEFRARGSMLKTNTRSWNPVTTATFDFAIAFSNTSHTALLIITDED